MRSESIHKFIPRAFTSESLHQPFPRKPREPFPNRHRRRTRTRGWKARAVCIERSELATRSLGHDSGWIRWRAAQARARRGCTCFRHDQTAGGDIWKWAL